MSLVLALFLCCLFLEVFSYVPAECPPYGEEINPGAIVGCVYSPLREGNSMTSAIDNLLYFSQSNIVRRIWIEGGNYTLDLALSFGEDGGNGRLFQDKLFFRAFPEEVVKIDSEDLWVVYDSSTDAEDKIVSLDNVQFGDADVDAGMIYFIGKFVLLGGYVTELSFFNVVFNGSVELVEKHGDGVISFVDCIFNNTGLMSPTKFRKHYYGTQSVNFLNTAVYQNKIVFDQNNNTSIYWLDGLFETSGSDFTYFKAYGNTNFDARFTNCEFFGDTRKFMAGAYHNENIDIYFDTCLFWGDCYQVFTAENNQMLDVRFQQCGVYPECPYPLYAGYNSYVDMSFEGCDFGTSYTEYTIGMWGNYYSYLHVDDCDFFGDASRHIDFWNNHYYFTVGVYDSAFHNFESYGIYVSSPDYCDYYSEKIYGGGGGGEGGIFRRKGEQRGEFGVSPHFGYVNVIGNRGWGNVMGGRGPCRAFFSEEKSSGKTILANNFVSTMCWSSFELQNNPAHTTYVYDNDLLFGVSGVSINGAGCDAAKPSYAYVGNNFISTFYGVKVRDWYDSMHIYDNQFASSFFSYYLTKILPLDFDYSSGIRMRNQYFYKERAQGTMYIHGNRFYDSPNAIIGHDLAGENFVIEKNTFNDGFLSSVNYYCSDFHPRVGHTVQLRDSGYVTIRNNVFETMDIEYSSMYMLMVGMFLVMGGLPRRGGVDYFSGSSMPGVFDFEAARTRRQLPGHPRVGFVYNMPLDPEAISAVINHNLFRCNPEFWNPVHCMEPHAIILGSGEFEFVNNVILDCEMFERFESPFSSFLFAPGFNAMESSLIAGNYANVHAQYFYFEGGDMPTVRDFDYVESSNANNVSIPYDDFYAPVYQFENLMPGDSRGRMIPEDDIFGNLRTEGEFNAGPFNLYPHCDPECVGSQSISDLRNYDSKVADEFGGRFLRTGMCIAGQCECFLGYEGPNCGVEECLEECSVNGECMENEKLFAEDTLSYVYIPSAPAIHILLLVMYAQGGMPAGSYRDRRFAFGLQDSNLPFSFSEMAQQQAGCHCISGWQGETCLEWYCDPDVVVCDSDPLRMGFCSSNNTCTCPSGWSGSPDCSHWSCDDVFCYHGVCNGSNSCECSTNWEGPECNVCPEEFALPYCELVCTIPNKMNPPACDINVCYDKILEDACNFPYGECIEVEPTINQCVCDETHVGAECMEELSVCSGFRSNEEGVCMGRGTCVGGVCHCDAPFENGALGTCEVVVCPGDCHGHGECLYSEIDQVSFCECDNDLINGHWSPKDSCLSCVLGYTQESNCIEAVCVYGDWFNGKCECHPFFAGDACSVCEENYYGVDCQQHCECVGENGLPSGKCSADGTECECFADSRGYYSGENPPKDCLLCAQRPGRYHMLDHSCLYGFYVPNDDDSWYTPDDPLDPVRLYFNEDYSVLWGYFTGPKETENWNLCGGHFTDPSFALKGCSFSIYRTKERIIGTGIHGSKKDVSIIAISGFSPLLTIGNTVTMDFGTGEISVPIMQFLGTDSVYGIGFPPPFPEIRAIRVDGMIDQCDKRDTIPLRPFVVNPVVGTTYTLRSNIEVLDNYLSVHFPVPIDVNVEVFIDVDYFQLGLNDITAGVWNIHGQYSESTVFVEKRDDGRKLEMEIEGEKFYIFQIVDSQKAYGTLSVRMAHCGDYIIDVSSFKTDLQQLSGPEINMEFVDVTPEKIDFFLQAFTFFDVVYRFKFSVNYTFEDPFGGSVSLFSEDEVAVYPEGGELVLNVPKFIQARTDQEVVIDASASIDPANSGEGNHVFFHCMGGCHGAIQQDPTNVFIARIPANEIEKDREYGVRIEWVKGNRKAETEIVMKYETPSFMGFQFVNNIQNEEFCLGGSDFISEYFYFFVPDRSELAYPDYRYYYDNNLVNIAISVENSVGEFSLDYFSEKPAYFEYAETVEDIHQEIRHYENSIGILDVYHVYDGPEVFVQNKITIHYKKLKEYLEGGVNVLRVSVTIDTGEEVIVGETTSQFTLVDNMENFAIQYQGMITMNKTDSYEQNNGLEICLEGAECEMIYPPTILVSMNFPSGDYVLEYSYDAMVTRFKVVYDDTGSFAGIDIKDQKKKKRFHYLDHNQNWISIPFGELVPYVENGITKIERVFGKTLLLPGSETIKVYSKDTKCDIRFDFADFDWKNSPDWMYNGHGGGQVRRKVELSFSQAPGFDTSPKTIWQKIRALRTQIGVLDIQVNSGTATVDTFIELIELYESYIDLREGSSEVPTVSSYGDEVAIHEVVTRLLNIGVELIVDLAEGSDFVNIFEEIFVNIFKEILQVEVNLMEYHSTHRELNLLPNANMNFVFSAIENIIFGCSLRGSGDEYSSVVARAKVTKQMFMQVLMNGNVDTYEEDVGMSNDFNSQIDLFHSKMLESGGGGEFMSNGGEISLSGEDSTKVSVTSTDYATNNVDVFGDSAMSQFISLNTNNEYDVTRKSLGIEFNMQDQLSDYFSSNGRRQGGGGGGGVAPFCYHFEEEVEEWDERESGSECVGVSEFFNPATGSVMCQYEAVPYNTSFVVSVQEFMGCVKRSGCPVLSLCSDFVMNNPQLLTSTSERLHLTNNLFLSYSNQEEGEDRRREEKLFKTIKSVCVTDDFGFVVDSNLHLFVFGSATDNAYLDTDSLEPVQIEVAAWDGYAPIKVSCTKSSVFVLAYNADKAVQTGKVFAFGKNLDYEMGGAPSDEFVEFANDVFDVTTSPHTVYVTFKKRIVDTEYKIKARGRNHHGALAGAFDGDYSTEHQFVDVDTSNFPADVLRYPYIVGMENCVFIELYLGENLFEYYYAGIDHPTTEQDENIPVKIEWNRRIDFVHRLMDGGCLYFVAEGKFYVSGSGDCAGVGIDANEEHSFHPHVLQEDQLGDYDPACSEIYDFTCGFACYLLCFNPEAQTLQLYTFGKTADGLGFDADCAYGVCDRLTLASEEIMAVIPGYGKTRVTEQQSLEIAYDALFVQIPKKDAKYLTHSSSYLHPPEIVHSQSGFLTPNTLTLTFKKPFVVRETESVLRFVLREDMKPNYANNVLDVYPGIDSCIFPFYDRSFWEFWNEDDFDGVSWNFYQISLSWTQFREDCDWIYHYQNDFDVYTNRLMFTENFMFDKSFGKRKTRSENFFFDFSVKFPKVVLKSDIMSVEQDAFSTYWDAYVTDKTFDRVSRMGQLTFNVRVKFPNYFVFADIAGGDFDGVETLERIDLDSINDMFFTEMELVEIPDNAPVHNPLIKCDQRNCFQEYILDFYLVDDYRLCVVPDEAVRVNFYHFCVDETHEDCVSESTLVPVEIVIGVDNLCGGSFVEEIETTFDMFVYKSWTYQNEYDFLEEDMFQIGDWMYVKNIVSSEKVSILSIEYVSIHFADFVLYEKAAGGITTEGEVARLIIDEFGDKLETSQIGFHLRIVNQITRLQPDQEEAFNLEVHLAIEYLGNLEEVQSRRNVGHYSEQMSLEIRIANFEKKNSGVLPYLFTGFVIAAGVLVVMLFIGCGMMLNLKKRKVIKKSDVEMLEEN